MVPQQAVKAYILTDCGPMTLVSVNELDRISWFLIRTSFRFEVMDIGSRICFAAHDPYMTISEAKRYIIDYFGDAYIERCTLPGQSTNLSDQSTFRHNGIKANNHHLSMRLRLFAS